MTTRFRGIPGLINVDRRVSEPLYQQIYDSLRMRITNGTLRPGQLVPSTRELARELRISRLPVLNAYAQLLAEGYFESRVGAGTFVATSLPASATTRVSVAAFSIAPTPRFISKDAARIPPYERPNWAASLGPFQVGQPDLHQFPIDTWLRLVRRYSRGMRVKALQYGDPMGRADLREAVATYLRTSRGVRCEPDQVMIVSGSQQALDLTTRLLLNSGDAVWVEEPGYWLVQRALQARGCRVVPVPVDADGLNIDAGVKLSRKARAAFVAPSHQYPLGVMMSASRRLQLLEWAQRAGAWLIEDDYDSEFRYDSMPIASLQGLDRNAHVIYVGTFSKVMFPSLRLGYLVAPRDLVERFAAMRQAIDICPADLTQAVAAEFIREGHFARHIRRMRPVYAERRRALVAAIGDELGNRVSLSGDEAGMHLALTIEGLRNDQKIATKAAQESLWLSALSQSYIGKIRRQGFVLGFGNTRLAQIVPAVRHLKAMLSRESEHLKL
jgi:GntR family transcriptional regulator/MocR family aminotransferase